MTYQVYWPFDVAEMIAEIEGMTAGETSAYLRLCMAYWWHGRLPGDEAGRWRISKLDRRDWRRAREAVAARFVVEGEVWKHPRLDGLRAMALDVRAKRAEAGRKGGEAKARRPVPLAPRARESLGETQLKLLKFQDPPRGRATESESESPSGGFYITPPEGVAGDARAREATAPPPPSPHPAASAPPPPNGRARGRRPPAHESDGREPYTEDEMRRIREGLAELKRRKAEAAS